MGNAYCLDSYLPTSLRGRSSRQSKRGATCCQYLYLSGCENSSVSGEKTRLRLTHSGGKKEIGSVRGTFKDSHYTTYISFSDNLLNRGWGDTPLMTFYPLRYSARRATARALCDTAFLPSGPISAKVRPVSSTSNTGS